MPDWMDRRSGWKAQPDDPRTPYEADASRVVHSGSFRRLQGKTQILNLGDSDFYRTRLTHSLEVAQIGCSLVRRIHRQFPEHAVVPHLPPDSLVQTLGYAHDLGHPPFGHGGEVALNYCMRDDGGFEGNGHTLRILSRLENFSKNEGSDLTRRALLGILKYPLAYRRAVNRDIRPTLAEDRTAIRIIDRKASKPPKCYFDSEVGVVEWLFEILPAGDRDKFVECERPAGKHAKSLHKSLDCTILDVADDIAYGVHDLEDVLALRLVDEAAFREQVGASECEEFLMSIRSKYGEGGEDPYGYFVSRLFGGGGWRKRFIGRLVHYFVSHLQVDTIEGFQEPLLKYRVCLQPVARTFLDALQALVVAEAIRSAEVQHLEFKGQRMVVSVFEAMNSEPGAFLPKDARRVWETSYSRKRAICDYVAGMTDAFLLKTYDRMFSPRMGSVFDKL